MPKISEYNQFFDRFDGFAVCKICGKKLQTKGGNTSGLKKHYEGQHSQSNVPNVTTPLKRKANEPPALETPSKVPKCDKDLVQPTIINFVTNEQSLHDRVSRFACQDLMTINCITKSHQIREFFKLMHLRLCFSRDTRTGL